MIIYLRKFLNPFFNFSIYEVNLSLILINARNNKINLISSRILAFFLHKKMPKILGLYASINCMYIDKNIIDVIYIYN